MKHFAFLLLLACLGSATSAQPVYRSDNLEIQKITEHLYLHISYMRYEDQKVSCNGLVFLENGQAIVFDTPTEHPASAELIHWIENSGKAKIKAVVINHFHHDCLGGLAAFHSKGISSYSSARTRELARADTANKPVLPQHVFDTTLYLTIGKDTVINKYFGEGHTPDNIVSYIPTEKVLFGGCMVKATGADKGYLGNANTSEWPATIRKIKSAFPGVRYVIPGHGDYGDAGLLDYTIQLFEDGKDR